MSLSDKFSRMRRALPDKTRVPNEAGHIGVPLLFSKIFESKEALLKCQFEIPFCENGFGPEWDCPKQEGAPSVKSM